MATSESTRARRFALPDLRDERTSESIEAFLEGQKDYKPNKHKVDDALKARIRERWKTYFDRYGYF